MLTLQPHAPPEAVRAYFAYRETPNFPTCYNIAPTQSIPVVCLDTGGKRSFKLMRWGLLPPFVKDPKQFPTLINARAEGGADQTRLPFRHAPAALSHSPPTASMNGREQKARGGDFCCGPEKGG